MMKETVLTLLITFIQIIGICQEIDKNKEFKLHKELLNQPPSLKRDTMVIQRQFDIITVYIRQQKLDSARYWVRDTESKLKKLDWERGWGFFYRTRGQYYVFALQKDSSVNDLIKAVAIFEKYKNWRQAGISSARLGNALMMDLKFDKSLFYLNNALRNFEEHNDYFSQCNTLNYLSNVYRSMNNYEKALAIHQKVLYLVKTHNLAPQLVMNKNVGMSYLYNNKIDSAKIFFQKEGIDIDKNPEVINDIYIYNRLGEYFNGAGMPQKAIQVAELSLKMSKKSNSTAYMRTGYAVLYDSYRALNNYELALKNFVLKKNLEDSLEKADVSIKLNQLEIQYQTQKKETEITKQKALLEANNLTILKNQSSVALLNKNLLLNQEILARQTTEKRLSETEYKGQLDKQKSNIQNLNTQSLLQKQNQTRNLLFAVLAFLSILTVILIYNYRKLLQKNKEISNATLKGQTTERKRVAADLHDNLGSTLSSLRFSLQAIDKKKLDDDEKEVYTNLQELIEKAYNDVRLLSHNLLPEEFEKQGLTIILQGFVRKMNKNSTIKFDLKISEDFGRVNNKIEFELYSICLELVNNIMKHSKATEAKIELSRTEKQIIFVISDNGIGVFNNDSDGKGMKNIKARVESLNGVWNLQNADNHGVTNEILIPI